MNDKKFEELREQYKMLCEGGNSAAALMFLVIDNMSLFEGMSAHNVCAAVGAPPAGFQRVYEARRLAKLLEMKGIL